MALFKRSKNTNKPLIRQILDFVPLHLIKQSVQRFNSDKGCSKYKTYDQFTALLFGQLEKCYTLSDLSSGLAVSSTYLEAMNLMQSPAKSTMSDGNKKRDWRVFEHLYYRLLSYYKHVLKPSHQTHIIEEVKNKTIKLIDSTTVSLCLSLFNWAKFRTAKGGLKIHTVWDTELALPDYINITEAKVHDSKGIENSVYKEETIIVEDRGYFDFLLMALRHAAKNYFVTRIKNNTKYETIFEVDLNDGEDEDILKDELIKLTSPKAVQAGMDCVPLRRIVVYKLDTQETIEIITNNLVWTARTIADLYKKRWDIELFFKAMKQNLQIKTFLGTSENAVKSQIYVALIAYLLVELIRRVICKEKVAFSNLCEKIRICIYHYLTLDYICNHIKPIVKKRQKPQEKNLFTEDNFQGTINFDP